MPETWSFPKMLSRYFDPLAHFLIAVTLGVGLLVCPLAVYADRASDSLTAAYLFKLAEKIQWPGQQNFASFHFHIASESKGIYSAMQSVGRLKKLNGKEITVSHVRSTKIPENTNVVFVSADRVNVLPEILTSLEGKPVLVVSEGFADKRRLMINIFQTEDNKQRFEINKANIINQNLGIDPDIILLGGTEIDVARLYREGQRALSRQSQELTLLQNQIRSLENEKERMEAILAADKIEVEKSAKELEAAHKQANRQNEKLALARTEVAKLQKTTRQQNQDLQRQATELARTEEELSTQQEKFNQLQVQISQQEASLEEKVLALKEREHELESQQAEIDKRTRVLEQQAQSIRNQDVIISEQEAILEEISSTLASERQWFILVSVIAVLILVLSISLILSNRHKKRTNLILEERTRQLETSEEKYHDIYDKAPGLMISVDIETRKIVECNQVLVDTMGFTREEIIGKEIFELYHPDSVATAHEVFERFKASNEIHDAELQLAKKDGEKIDVLLDVSLRIDKKTGKKYTLSIWRDITERKQLEKSILQAKEAAEAASLAKSSFLANMSHELRTPLNAILGFSAMLTRDQQTSAENREKLTIINRSGEHLLGMINDVLDLSKIEAGHIELEEEFFDLPAMLRDVGQMFEVRADSAGLLFNLELDPQLPQIVRADVGKLRQILINLLGNAAKFTSKGGFAFRVRTQAIANGSDQLKLQFEVQDSGTGIPEEYKNDIFKPFVQAGRSPTAGKGTGLGLAITYSFVKLMGGNIDVQSTPGEGSMFRVEVPVESSKEKAESLKISTSRPTVSGLEPDQQDWRILIVEDNADNRLLITSLLTQVGFDIRVAENGEEAITLFRQWRPHFIWMDLRMPVMDGYEATAKIRQLPDGKDVKIVALTASAFKEERAGILAAGCDEVVYKPFQVHVIFETMAELLGLRYRYQDSVETTKDTLDEIHAEAILELPLELRQALRSAATSLNADALEAVLAQIPVEQVETSRGLSNLAKEFRFDLILELLDEVDSRQQ